MSTATYLQEPRRADLGVPPGPGVLQLARDTEVCQLGLKPQLRMKKG